MLYVTVGEDGLPVLELQISGLGLSAVSFQRMQLSNVGEESAELYIPPP